MPDDHIKTEFTPGRLGGHPGFWWLGRLVLAAGICAMWGCDWGPRMQAEEDPVPMAGPRLAQASPVTLYASLADAEQIPFRARSVTSLMRHSFTQDGADGDPDIAVDGQQMVFHSTRHSLHPDLYLKLVDGTSVTQLTSHPASDVQAAFSPMADRIAFASDRAGNWDIWVKGIEGQKATQVTHGKANEVYPSWSPEGDRLVYCSQSPRSGQWELWIVGMAEKASPRFISDGAFPQWHPSKDLIVYQRAKARGSRRFSIWTIELTDGEPRYPTEVSADPARAFVTPAWSPEGDKIAFASILEVTRRVEGQKPEDVKEYVVQHADLWVVDADGRGRMRLTDEVSNDFSPVWGSNGRIFFVSDRQGPENIWSVLPVSPALPSTPAPQGRPPARLSVNQPLVPASHIGPEQGEK